MSDAADGAARRSAINASVMAASDVVGKVATLGYTVLAARVLSQQDFGLFSYAVALSLLLAIVPQWGFDTYVVQQGAEDHDRVERLYAESLAWKVGLGVPLVAGAAVFAVLTSSSTASAVALVAIVVAGLLDVLSDSGRAAANAIERLVGVSVALTLNRIVTAGLAIAALLAGGELVGIALAYLAGSVTGLVVTVVAIRRVDVRTRIGPVRWDRMRAMAVGSWEIGVAALVGVALFRVDTVILEAVRGEEAVAVYSVAYRLLETVLFVAWAIGRANLPAMSAATDPARVRRVLEESVSAVAALYVPFGIALATIGPQVVGLLFGERYEAVTVTPLRWLALAPLVFAVGYLASYALVGVRRERAMLVGSLAALGANVVANLLLIPRWGVAGAAATTTLSYLLQSVVALGFGRSSFGLARVDRVLVVPLVASVPMAAVLVLLDAPVVVVAATGGVVYAVAWFALAQRFAPHQIALLRSMAPGRG